MCMCNHTYTGREEIGLNPRFFVCYSAWFVQEGFASQFQSSNLDELVRVYFMSFYVITFVSRCMVLSVLWVGWVHGCMCMVWLWVWVNWAGCMCMGWMGVGGCVEEY